MQFLLNKYPDGRTTGGKAIRDHIERIKPGLYRVQIKGWGKISKEQRALWWIWIEEIARHTGHERWELHYFLKLRFAELTLGPDGLPEIPSIEDNTPEQQAKLLDALQRWAKEYHDIDLKVEGR